MSAIEGALKAMMHLLESAVAGSLREGLRSPNKKVSTKVEDVCKARKNEKIGVK